MIKIDEIQMFNLDNAIRGARNPLNSWARSDSHYENGIFVLGKADKDLALRLCKAGSDHRKFLRQVFVTMDITAPLYWWKEFDTYKVGTVANSCSTMHTIHKKEFTLDDFSLESFVEVPDKTNLVLTSIIHSLNTSRALFLETADKTHWLRMIQLLPSSYNQKRTVTMSYENLINMYKSRQYHKLNEWRDFCECVITELPYLEDFIHAIDK